MAPVPAPAAEIGARPQAARGPWQLAWARLRRDRVAIGSFAVICFIALLAIFAPVVAALVGHGPDTQYRTTGLSPNGIPVGPSARFLFGTDDLGRDVFVRVVYGARISLLVGVVATGIAIAIGVVVGLAAGYFGRTVDSVLGRSMDVVLSL